jgi:hypothetical protein
MQMRSGIGAQPDDVAGVGRDFRLIEYQAEHAGRRKVVVIPVNCMIA